MKKALFAAAFIALLASCQTSSQKQPTTPTPPPASGKLDARTMTTFRCVGTEPFWNLTIDPNGVIFSHMDLGKTHYPIPSPFPAFKNGMMVLETSDGTSKLKLTLKEETCSDGMSEDSYPYSAVVERDGTTFKGCGESSLQPKTNGEK